MENNAIKIYTDRSRTISYQECHRRRFHGYHYAGIGLAQNKLNIPLATGTWTHHGLALLMQGRDIDYAVKEAIEGYWKEIKKRGILVESGEDAAYVADEQCALVEGMLRAYHIVQLPKLLEEYEVLETEREEDWIMTEWIAMEGEPLHSAMLRQFVPVPFTSSPISQDENGNDIVVEGMTAPPNVEFAKVELHWMARADALLREKSSGDLYVHSFKTAASWDARKSRENEHDMQGLSELAAVEYRLHKMWNRIQEIGVDNVRPYIGSQAWMDQHGFGSARLLTLLVDSPTPPRISGVKMEYLLKGDRYADKNGDGRKIQRSPLIRGYQRMNAPTTGDPNDLGWKYEYTEEATGKTKRLDYRSWKQFEVWNQPGGVKAWIELLALGAIQPDAGEPLGLQFITPVPYFRNDDDVRDWYEQIVVQERQVAEDVQIVEDAVTLYGWASPEVRSLMNQKFPQYRRSCDWPSSCSFVDICYGASVGEDPVNSGLYIERVPHHEPELVHIQKAGE